MIRFWTAQIMQAAVCVRFGSAYFLVNIINKQHIGWSSKPTVVSGRSSELQIVFLTIN